MRETISRRDYCAPGLLEAEQKTFFKQTLHQIKVFF